MSEQELNQLAATNSNAQNDTLTLDTLKEMSALLDRYDEPYAKFMRSEGFDPKNGDVLILPWELRSEAPKYVMFSRTIKHGGVMMKNPQIPRSVEVIPPDTGEGE